MDDDPGGYRVPMTVPKLLMKASPGPVTRKNPPASHHMVVSPRNLLVSAFSSQSLRARSSASRAFNASASDRRKLTCDSERSVGCRVP